jgi:hypothetical protein
MPNLFFILNLAFVRHPLVVLLSGQNINLDLFYNTKMLTKNERSIQITMNPKAQVIFVHTFVDVIFTYMLQVKDLKKKKKKTIKLVCLVIAKFIMDVMK